MYFFKKMKDILKRNLKVYIYIIEYLKKIGKIIWFNCFFKQQLNDGFTPLIVASTRRQLSVVKYLSEKEGNKN